MRFIKQNPRRALILALYLLVFVVVSWIIHGSVLVLLLGYAALTLILIGVFFADCVAVIGNIYWGQGKTEKSVALLKKSIALKTKSPMAYLHYAIYLLRRDGAAEAYTLLDTALQLKPKILAEKNIQLTRASCMWVMGDVDKAVDILENMRKTYDYVNVHVLSTLAYMYFLKDDFVQAEALSQAAIEDTPSSAAAWDNLGQIYLKQNDIPKAQEAFLKATEYKSDLADSLFYLGVIAEKQNEAKQAADYYQRALQCNITSLNTVSRTQIEASLAGLHAE